MDCAEPGETLRSRPLTGSEYEIETIIPELEMSPVRCAAFEPPDVSRTGPREAAQLLFGEADRRALVIGEDARLRLVAPGHAETGERSVLYVALTRARRSATITGYGKLSGLLPQG